MAAALKKAGSTDGDKLKAALESGPLTLEFPGGATMTIQFFGKEYYGVDHNWQPNQYIAVTENGKLVQKEVLSPVDQLQYVALIAKYKGTAGGEYTPPPEEIAPTETGAPKRLTVDSTVGALMDNPDTRAILEKYMAKNIADPRFKMTYSLSLRALFSLSPAGSYPPGTLEAIEADLNALYGGEATPTPTATTPPPTTEPPATTPPPAAIHTGLDANSTFGELLDNPQTKAIIYKIIGEQITPYESMFEARRGEALSTLLPRMKALGVTDAQIQAITDELAAVK